MPKDKQKNGHKHKQSFTSHVLVFHFIQFRLHWDLNYYWGLGCEYFLNSYGISKVLWSVNVCKCLKIMRLYGPRLEKFLLTTCHRCSCSRTWALPAYTRRSQYKMHQELSLDGGFQGFCGSWNQTFLSHGKTLVTFCSVVLFLYHEYKKIPIAFSLFP